MEPCHSDIIVPINKLPGVRPPTPRPAPAGERINNSASFYIIL